MSLSKRLCIRSETINRQSFDERICDDLCEVILQFLSFEDKLKLECVSKQFQRTIFVKQNELEQRTNFHIILGQGLDLQSLESVLKKCPNITRIKFTAVPFRGDNYNQSVKLITKYCHNLVHYNSSFTEMSEKVFEEFHNKFRFKLKPFPSIRSEIQFERLNRFPKTEKLLLDRISSSDYDPKAILDFDLNDVKTFETYIRHFHVFWLKVIKKFKELKSLSLRLYSVNENEIIAILDAISSLKNLIHLRFNLEHVVPSRFDNGFTVLLKHIPIICQNLKSIETIVYVNQENYENLRQMLTPLKSFRSLKRLKFLFDFDDHKSSMFDKKSKKIKGTTLRKFMTRFSFNSFNGLSNITHLDIECADISFWVSVSFKAKMFKDIDIYLPELKSLKISNRILFNLETMKGVVDTLSRLSRLETLHLNVQGYVSDQMKVLLSQKCLNLKTIKL